MDTMPPSPRAVVFGSPDRSKKAANSDGSSSNSNSSDDSKQNPLLDSKKNNSKRRRRYLSRGGYADVETSEGATFCRCIGHLLVLFMPLIAMSLMLAFLSLLVVYDKENLQDFDWYEGEGVNATNIAEMYYTSVRSDSISMVMSQYDPYVHVLGLSSAACVLISMVTVARNIQIEVYHKRTGSFIFMKFINYLAAIINIVSYIGLMVAVNFKATQESPEWAPRAHYIGFLVYFAGTATYAVLHQFLLWRQAEYPTLIKVLFFALSALTVGSSFAFGVPLWFGGLETDALGEPVFEWVAVFASAISIGLYVILFFIDPADDQVTSFFLGDQKVVIRSESRRERGKRMRRAQLRLQAPSKKGPPLAYNMMPVDNNTYGI